MIEEHLAEVSPVGEIKLEENLAPECDVPPKIMPSGKASVDRISELLLTQTKEMRTYQYKAFH